MDWENWIQNLPWLTLVVGSIPFLLAAWKWRVFPRLTVLYPMTALLAFSFLIPFHPDWTAVWLILATLIATFIVGDSLTLAGRSKIHIERIMQRAASLNAPQPATLRLDNFGTRTMRMFVRDDCLQEVRPTPDKHWVSLPPGKRIELDEAYLATRRGAYNLETVYLQLQSRFGLWDRLIQKQVPSTLHVYPDMKQLGEYALLAKTNRLSLIGVKKTRKLGQDNNFERLRDYQHDDNYKHIEWRTTARRQKLTVKQFQADQSQRIIFLLDCGRMMTNQYEGLSLLDYALNSILMLSYVALKQGDSVGLVCFSDKVHEFVPLRGGPNQMNRLLHAGFDRFPSLVASRFDQAFLYLSAHCRRRSMVVLVTNVIDQVSADQVVGYLQNLGGRHLPVLALLRDHRMFDSADNPTLDDSVLYRSAAAAQILTWRHEVLQRISRNGVLVVDAFPEQLTAPLVNQYLEVKAKHLL